MAMCKDEATPSPLWQFQQSTATGTPIQKKKKNIDKCTKKNKNKERRKFVGWAPPPTCRRTTQHWPKKSSTSIHSIDPSPRPLSPFPLSLSNIKLQTSNFKRSNH
jgi:hypothetical protein